MDLKEYQEAALRTAGLTREYRHRLAVAGMGLSGEAAEVLDVAWNCGSGWDEKMVKELGDVMWYVAETASTCGVALADVPLAESTKQMSVQKYAVHLSIHAGALTDYLKKVVGHGHELDVAKVVAQTGNILRFVEEISLGVGSSMRQVCSANIAKLEARYRNGFRPEDSINRPAE